MRAVYIGTLAPASSGWWHDLIAAGSGGSAYVQALQGDQATWDSWHTIRKANPLANISAELRSKLLEERDKARADSRLKGRFLSYRLNLPTADESTMLLTVEDWTRACGREVPERDGRPLSGSISEAVERGRLRLRCGARDGSRLWRRARGSPDCPSKSDGTRSRAVPTGCSVSGG